jgi:WD40 repeat protein/serine/threonine protein kinase
MLDPQTESGADPELDRAIVEWFDAVKHQGTPDAEEFILRHPECSGPLREFLASYLSFQQLANDAGNILSADALTHSSPKPEQAVLEEMVRQGGLPQNASIGEFEDLQEIARGGMGVVFKGRDRELKRVIALKVLQERHRGEAVLNQRFVEEAQIAGQLQHPGITPVYSLGEFPDHRPYFTMKLVQGQTLARLLEQRSNPQEELQKFLKIFEQVCQTLAYAHSRRVIHRDLKPSNIMVGDFGEVQVMDWGLAKVLPAIAGADPSTQRESIQTVRNEIPAEVAGSSSQTQFGSILGTLAFMPPEQALGEIEQVDQRSDVFGLGAILCNILTGRPPYVAKSLEQLRRMAVRAELGDAFESLDRCEADPDLKQLTRRALSPDPAHRPSDAAVLVQELSQYREGVETRLRQAELAEVRATAHAMEERSRRKQTLRYLGVVLLVLAIGVIGTSFGLFREYRAKEDLRRELYVADLQLADQIRQSGNGTARQVAELLAAHIPIPGKADLREFTWRLQWSILNRNSLVLHGTGRAVRIAIVSSDKSLTTLDDEQLLQHWQLPEGTVSSESRLTGTQQVSCWSNSADGRRIALGSVHQVRVFDVQTGELVRALSGRSLVQALSLSRDGRQLAVAWGDGGIQKWNVDEPGEDPFLDYLPSPRQSLTVDRMELSPDAASLYLLDYPESGQVTCLKDNQERVHCQTGHDSSVYSIAFSPDGNWRATGDANGQICLSHGETQTMIPSVHSSAVSSLAFSSDGHWLATGGVEGVVTIWDVERQQQLCRFKGHQDRIHNLSFSPDLTSIASASDDGTTRVWNLNAEGASRLFGDQDLPVFSLAYSRDGSRLAIGTGNGKVTPGGIVKVRDTQSHSLVKPPISAAEGRVLALDFSLDGKLLITGGYDSTLRIWNLDSQASPRVIPAFPTQDRLHFRQSAIGSLAVSPDGTLIAASFGHPTIHQSDYAQVAKIWDLDSGGLVATLEGHSNTIGSVAFSPDGKQLATASDDRQIILWSTDNWKKLLPPLTGPERFKSVTFSPDGKWVVAGDSMGTVTFWDSARGRLIKKLRGHATAVQRVLFSPDGRTLATASWDNTIKLWDPVSGRETQTLREHHDWISCIAFSPDGNTLATGSFDATVRLWNAADLASIEMAVAKEKSVDAVRESNSQRRLQERLSRPAAALNRFDLDACSGLYENGLTVESGADHLIIRPIEGHAGADVRLYAQSTTEFFARDCNLDVTFLKDNLGNVSRVVIVQEGLAFEALRTR